MSRHSEENLKLKCLNVLKWHLKKEKWKKRDERENEGDGERERDSSKCKIQQEVSKKQIVE